MHDPQFDLTGHRVFPFDPDDRKADWPMPKAAPEPEPSFWERLQFAIREWLGDVE